MYSAHYHNYASSDEAALGLFRSTRPSDPDVLSIANGDGISGVTDRESVPGRFALVPAVGFLRRLSEAVDEELPLRFIW